MRPLVLADRQAALVFYAAVSAWFLTEMVIGFRYRTPRDSTARDRGSRFIVAGAVVLGVWIAYAIAFGVPATAIRWHRHLLLAAGVGIMVAGMALRWYAIRTLGPYFSISVATQQNQRVIEQGPYRLVRHPSYSASLLTFSGMCLALANSLTFVSLLVPLLAFAYRIGVEEAALVEALGDDYRRYMRRTKRLVPHVL